MQEILLTIGLPGSGKSTWADEYIQHNPDYYNVNRDDIRLMVQGRARYKKFTKTRENLVTQTQFDVASTAIKAGKSVIVSDTNLNPDVINKWEQFAKDRGVAFQKKLFTDVPIGVLIARDKLREFPVTANIITGMFERYREIYWPKPVIDESLPNAYIVDVDGTIAHMHNRRPYEWDKVGDDLPKQDIIRIINTLYNAGNKIIICSGRDGVSKDGTAEWLTQHNVNYNKFFIRPAGDCRKDYVIKEEIYNTHIKGKYNVLGVFDDRDQVVFLWRHLGLTCLQVDYGDF